MFTLLVIAPLLLGLIVLLLAVRLLLVFVRKKQFIQYWHKSLAKRPAENAITLVALGDSISVGVGAGAPQKTLIGQAKSYIESQTGRPVHVQNYGFSGATADHVAKVQLPKANLAAADIVLLEIGANDTRKRTPRQYSKDMAAIIAKLPLAKTVIADVPMVASREPYQAELDTLLQSKKVARAHLKQVFQVRNATRGITAGDFFHPNNKGYRLWFQAFRQGIDEVLNRARLLGL